jgi:uncharacterized 2Fe-2S/4Fe-4S cluster protein (DUF4445 family)
MTPIPDNRWVTTVTLSPPSLEDNTADADRLEAALKKTLGTRTIHMDPELLKQLPTRLTGMELPGHRRAVQETGGDGVLVHLAAPDASEPCCGLAVDLGTTRVVLRIIDLSTGKTPSANRCSTTPRRPWGPMYWPASTTWKQPADWSGSTA